MDGATCGEVIPPQGHPEEDMLNLKKLLDLCDPNWDSGHHRRGSDFRRGGGNFLGVKQPAERSYRHRDILKRKCATWKFAGAVQSRLG